MSSPSFLHCVPGQAEADWPFPAIQGPNCPCTIYVLWLLEAPPSRQVPLSYRFLVPIPADKGSAHSRSSLSCRSWGSIFEMGVAIPTTGLGRTLYPYSREAWAVPTSWRVFSGHHYCQPSRWRPWQHREELQRRGFGSRPNLKYGFTHTYDWE